MHIIDNNMIELIGKNVPSKKNSKQLTRNKRIISSKLVREYEKWALPLLQAQYTEWQDMIKDKQAPLKVGFHFKRDSRRKWDFVNIIQVVADLMQDALYLSDDDTKHFIPIFLDEELTKKEKSGVTFEIL